MKRVVLWSVVFLGVVVWGVGCSSAPEESTPQNDQVNVQVKGLPSGETAVIALTNFATAEVESLVFNSDSSSQGISLSQGTYQVTANTVFSGKDNRQVLSAAIDKPVVHVINNLGC